MPKREFFQGHTPGAAPRLARPSERSKLGLGFEIDEARRSQKLRGDLSHYAQMSEPRRIGTRHLYRPALRRRRRPAAPKASELLRVIAGRHDDHFP